MELVSWLTVGSTAISATALTLNAYTMRVAHSGREMEGVFQLWDRYERYVKDITAVQAGNPEDQRIPSINMLNFLEHSALIYNKSRTPRIVKSNITSLINGYVDMFNDDSLFIATLDKLGQTHGNYEELRIFCRKRARLGKARL